jgi:hypothetical protein
MSVLLSNNVLIPSAAFAALEAFHWFFLKKMINKTLDIKKSDSVQEDGNRKTVGFIITLIIQLFALIYFLILGFATIFNAFIFGVVLQGFNTSLNYTCIKDWNMKCGLTCVLWKGLLFAFAIYISKML